MLLSSFFVVGFASLVTKATAELLFNVTAVGAQNGLSTIECWEVNAPFDVSEDQATSGSSVAHLGDVKSMSLSFAQPGDEPGAHTAPTNQWVVLLKGMAEISLAHDPSQKVFISGGEFGLLFASDTEDVSCCGHTSKFLGSEGIVYLQIPTVDNEIPKHTRLHMGACGPEELTGWR